MADLTNTKGRSVWPMNALENSWNRLEPLVNPEQLRKHFLFGIPLYSAMKDPVTGLADKMTDEILREIIERAVSIAESDCHIEIFPVQHSERINFDKQEYEAFGRIQLHHRPVSSVQSLDVVPSNDQVVYQVPKEWWDLGGIQYGVLHIVPLTIAVGTQGFQPVQSSGGAVFLSIFANRQWVPFFWQVSYISGFPDSQIPKLVNELIGTIAAMEALSQLAATYARSTSTSLGLDGMSQSQSFPGPALFQQRMQELAEKRKKISGKLRAKFATKFAIDHV